MQRIAALAHAYNIPIAPYVGASSGICAAASVQAAAAIPNLGIYEHMSHGAQRAGRVR
jgi:L-alanine-DL-glutamate epimerase-like enolase superfamily enzyme